VRTGRRLTLKIPTTWPWAEQVTGAGVCSVMVSDTGGCSVMCGTVSIASEHGTTRATTSNGTSLPRRFLHWKNPGGHCDNKEGHPRCPRRDDTRSRVRQVDPGRAHIVGPATIHVILQRAVERGEVERWIMDSRRATIATDLLRNHFLLFGAPVADEVIVDIVEDVYLPLVLRPAPEPMRDNDSATDTK
jgi:hypothetical protein